ncbi:MAG TPA: hypothetical protein VFD00_02115 [Thermoclostridium sp.]|nr:hypothetical protein [Thermoclostridium sp.]
MVKITKKKIIMIVTLIIANLGYFYIMVFRTPGVREVLALIILAVALRFTADFIFSHESKLSNYIYIILFPCLQEEFER